MMTALGFHYVLLILYDWFAGYFDFVKQLGYNWGHIWACPPSEGDDYIFHAHPTDQKVPKPKRLQEWYRKMLDKVRKYHKWSLWLT